jgi:hypothetical protein
MLEIKPIKSYKLPKYPQGLYCGPPENYPWNLINTGIASAALLALLGCSCPIGVAGPPPMPPNYITEREARTIINEAFAKHGIQFEEDVPCTFSLDGSPLSVTLDGFNKELKIGYEYVYDDADSREIPIVLGPLPLIAGENTDINDPSILVIQKVSIGYDDQEYPEGKQHIENAVDDFVHELQSHGIL